MRSTFVGTLVPATIAVTGTSTAMAAGGGPETLTVESARASTRVAKIDAFVTTHLQLSHSGQLARWQSPICPMAVGLPAGFATFVSARIRDVAQRAGVPVAAASCEANIIIAATRDPQRLLDDIAEHRHEMLGVYFLPDEEDVKAVRWPIQAWHMTATRSRSGTPRLDDAYRPSAPGEPGSRLSPGRSSMLLNVLVVVDLKTLGGSEIGPLADYIAMLALTQSSVTDECSAIPTILDLFARNCADAARPTSLTPADRSFLAALYKTDRESVGFIERSQIINAMSADSSVP